VAPRAFDVARSRGAAGPLEDHDDVQKVYHNAEIPDEVLSGA